jgi:16S rRNA (uracil1498-N3)-methyltransferase
VKLEENESNHALRVMRLREGAPVEAMDGSGRSVRAKLRLFEGVPHLEFVSEERAEALETVPVVLELAVLKGDAMEWAVEKAVELGIEALVPVLTERTIVRMDRKGPEAFQERWQKIADQALKQCGRLQRLSIEPPRELGELFGASQEATETLRFWLDEESEATESLWDVLQNLFAGREKPSLPPVRILIGPEGGWGDAERDFLSREAEKGACQRLSLGPLTLRAETAALSACALTAACLRSLTSRTVAAQGE